jgi:hypothetical protein
MLLYVRSPIVINQRLNRKDKLNDGNWYLAKTVLNQTVIITLRIAATNSSSKYDDVI